MLPIRTSRDLHPRLRAQVSVQEVGKKEIRKEEGARKIGRIFA